MPSQLTIATRASSLLGGGRLANLNDNTPLVNWVNDHFMPLHLQGLLSYPWSFAVKNVSLSLDSASAQTKAHRYLKNADFLRLIQGYSGTYPIYDLVEFPTAFETDSSTLTIDQISQVPPENLPNYYVQFLVYYLAQHMAISFTDQIDKAVYFGQLADLELQKACLFDKTNYQNLPPFALLNQARFN